MNWKLKLMKNNIAERTIVINRDLEKRLEEIISIYPGLNFRIIVNQALEEWLRGPQANNSNRNSFIIDASQGFGPIFKSRVTGPVKDA